MSGWPKNISLYQNPLFGQITTKSCLLFVFYANNSITWLKIIGKMLEITRERMQDHLFSHILTSGLASFVMVFCYPTPSEPIRGWRGRGSHNTTSELKKRSFCFFFYFSVLEISKWKHFFGRRRISYLLKLNPLIGCLFCFVRLGKIKHIILLFCDELALIKCVTTDVDHILLPPESWESGLLLTLSWFEPVLDGRIWYLWLPNHPDPF